jgi:asparagine synthase (glutamine-hydrolysing)
MCGIAGILRFDGAPVDRTVLRRMAGLLAHRGPDGEGFYCERGVGLAHRRLAIIDPAGGQQPFVDRESGLAITYNGEVYNFIEIRRTLGGESFLTASDTEVVLRAWQRWGPRALERFRGMFAFAIVDPKAGRAFLVRDRLGIKPLYYRLDESGLCFASELGALLPAITAPLDIDHAALSLYLRYGYVPTPHTIYRGICKLEPGTMLTVDLATGNAAAERYWRLEPRQRALSEADATAALDHLLQETVRLYVRSDVPFGAFLSGGVDSSLVAALMSGAMETPVRSFSIGFEESSYNELPYADAAARRIGAEHRPALLDAAVSATLLRRVAARFGEPFADSSCLPTWYVSSLAAEHVKMVLSGDGGDELFGGYQSYAAVWQASRSEAHRSPIARLVGIAPWRRANAGSAWQTEHHMRRDTFSLPERRTLTGMDPVGDSDEAIAHPDDFDPVTRCQLRDVRSYLLDDILVKVDRMSMDNSLEVRVPLLDHEVVEFAFSLPLDLRLRAAPDGNLTQKYLLKRVAEPFFPREFLDRPKWGFGIPLQKWLEGPLRELVGDLIDAGAAGFAPLLAPEAIRRVIRAFHAGHGANVGQVWALLSLRLWLDATMEQRSAATAAIA